MIPFCRFIAYTFHMIGSGFTAPNERVKGLKHCSLAVKGCVLESNLGLNQERGPGGETNPQPLYYSWDVCTSHFFHTLYETMLYIYPSCWKSYYFDLLVLSFIVENT